MPLADGSEGRIFAGIADILESAPRDHEEPKLVIRKAPHVSVWSVWAVLEGTHSEELFEGSTEEEASNWINSAGQAWLEERAMSGAEIEQKENPGLPGLKSQIATCGRY